MQLAFAVDVVAHKRTVLGTKVAAPPAVSLDSGEIVWFVSYAPDDVSLVATGNGGGTTVGVIVAPVN